MKPALLCLLILLAAPSAPVQPPDVQALFEQGAAAVEAEQYEQARGLFEQIAALEGIDPGVRALAKLRVADSFVLEQRQEDAIRACEQLAQTEDIPPHLEWEAAQYLARLKSTGAESRKEIEAAPAPAATFYIGVNGNDSAQGTKQEPFATFGHALDAVRALKKTTSDGQMPAGGARIRFLPGIYRIREGLEVPGDVSGRPGAPLAIDGPGARISGGVEVKNLKPVEAPAILERLPEEARGNVLIADLKSAGVEAIPAFQTRGYSKPAQPYLDVYVGGRPMKLSRWPNEGFVETGEVVEPALRDSGKSQAVFHYNEDRAQRWLNAKDLFLYGYWFWDWADNVVRVADIDTEARTFTLADPTSHGVKEGQWYCAMNLLEEIDQPGEWYLDREAGRLYLWLPENGGAETVEVSVLADPLLRLSGASHVRVERLTFETGAWHGIQIDGARDCLVAGCDIRRVAATGVVINDCRDSGVVSCDIHTLGRGGVAIAGGDRITLEPGGLFVENCHIYDYSRVDHTYTPAVLMNGCGNRIAHNDFHNSSCQGVRLEGNDHVLEFNKIHDVVRETDDQGGLDMWGNPTYRGNILRYNHWHDIGNGRPCGQSGIRLDDAISGTVVYGNVFERCSGSQFGAVQIHGGKDNWIDNNVMADCKFAISLSQWGKERWEKYLASDRIQGLMNDVDATGPLYTANYPELERLHEGNDVNRIWRNIAFNCGGFIAREKVKQIQAANLVVEGEDRDWKNLIADGTATKKIGFRPIPFDEIGLYDDAYRVGSKLVMGGGAE